MSDHHNFPQQQRQCHRHYRDGQERIRRRYEGMHGRTLPRAPRAPRASVPAMPWFSRVLLWILLLLATYTIPRSAGADAAPSSSSSFPGTIRPLPLSSQENNWHQQQQQTERQAPQGNSNSDEGESSSDWDDEWLEAPSPLEPQLQEEQTQVLSSWNQASSLSRSTTSMELGLIDDDDDDDEEEEDNIKDPSKIQSSTDDEQSMSRSVPLLSSRSRLEGDSATQLSSSSHSSKSFYKASSLSSSSSTDTTSGSSSSKTTRQPTTELPSNKPLKTLEKLQQMLDETDYLTTTSRRKMNQPITEFNDSVSLPLSSSSSSSFSPELDNVEQDASGMMISDEYDLIAGSTDDETTSTDTSTTLTPLTASTIATSINKENALWTSKDRSKYKRQQRHAKKTKVENPNSPPLGTSIPPTQSHLAYRDHISSLQQQRTIPPYLTTQPTALSSPFNQDFNSIASSSSDVEDPSDDTDDGLGYTLPNLPVYLSDDEGDYSAADTAAGSGATTGMMTSSTSFVGQLQSTESPANASTGVAEAAAASLNPLPPELNNVPIIPGYFPPYTNNAYQMPPWATTTMSTSPSSSLPPPYNHYPPQSPEQLHQYYLQQQHQFGYPGWVQMQPRAPYFHSPRPYVPRIDQQVSNTTPVLPAQPAQIPSTGYHRGSALPHPSHQLQQGFQTRDPTSQQGPLDAAYGKHLPPAEAGTSVVDDYVSHQKRFHLQWTLDSISKLGTCLALATVVCYSAVSPRDLPFLEYNRKFYGILRIASAAIVPPLILFALVVDWAYNPLPRLVSAFYYAFTIGYILTFCLEIVAATITRLVVFWWWEPNAFEMAPQVPLVVMPWVLRDQKYLVKPITLIVQDLVTSAVVCPVIEEWMKFILLQRTIVLGKNFRWIRKPSKKNPKKRKWVADALIPGPWLPSELTLDDEENKCIFQAPGQVVNVNHYVSGMLAVSLGLKLADAIRRVCMYTKADDLHKTFYSVCRGLFPIQELCGTVTALALARRDVLGQKQPLWKMLLPAAIIHGMANFRGKKPIFKWNSATPWSEMQLSPHFRPQDATVAQLVGKAFPKVMWLILLFRVIGYCVKNYYMINRQAVKRTTTYAGKHAAFSAELAAAEMLKSTKNSKEKREK